MNISIPSSSSYSIDILNLFRVERETEKIYNTDLFNNIFHNPLFWKQNDYWYYRRFATKAYQINEKQCQYHRVGEQRGANSVVSSSFEYDGPNCAVKSESQCSRHGKWVHMERKPVQGLRKYHSAWGAGLSHWFSGESDGKRAIRQHAVPRWDCTVFR